ncbi:Uncharacterised protein [Chryseobacterium nakagawai]|uniref:XRE family transcriptional regulator n=1 Tax=Chryseobacterium nakagawai TaxID=1241982 RepID=A0AAD0YQV8_CHRNA|nr:helix-turn-helix transcriptional regulator [Chryseobacterium nakagawai]AZA93013.1 XRE family transcriptional regulator [Chryseobacterium nakagawai]VEH19643.1 Uncharacterised protein [Chryseobacterium nakagawai]
MTISEKIKLFFIQKKVTYDEIGKLYGSSGQTVGNYVNGRREIPTDFLFWLKKNYPEIDFNKLFEENDSHHIVTDKNNIANKDEIKKEIDKILDQFLK